MRLCLRRVGIDVPTIEVRFERLVAEAEVRVGNSGLPTVLNSITNTLEVMIHRNQRAFSGFARSRPSLWAVAMCVPVLCVNRD